MKIISVIFLWCYGTWAFTQSYPYRQYSSKDGLTSNIVYDAIQDERGFMWFATNIGVSRFDGVKWVNYTIDNGLSDNEILKIKKDAKGRLWLLAFNGAINIIENDNILNEKNCPLLAQIEKGFYYRHFYSDETGMVWISNTRTKTYHIKDLEIVESFGKLDFAIIFKNEKGLVSINKENKIHNEHVTMPPSFKNDQLVSWQIFKDTMLLGLSEKCIYRLHQNTIIREYPLKLPLNFNFVDFYFMDEKDLWIIADKNGVLRYKLENNEYVVKERLFKDNYITSTYIDNEGNYWFTSYGSGIFMMPKNFEKILTYNQSNGLQGNDVFSVFVDEKQNIWAGHKYEYVDIVTNNQILNTQLTNSNVTVGRVRNIQSHKSGAILVAYDEGFIVTDFNKSLQKRNTRVLLEMSNGNIHFEQPVKDVAYDSKGNIFIASQENIHFLNHLDIYKNEPLAKALKLKPHRIYTLTVDSNDDIWFFGAEGLAQYKLGTIHKYEVISREISGRAEDMIWVNDKLFISTVGNGVYIIQDKKIVANITSKDGLMSNHCSKMFAFGNDVYVCTNQGLNKITGLKGNKFDVSRISANSQPEQINDVFVNDKSIYLASLEGITVIPNKSFIAKNILKPNIFLDDVIYKGKSIIHEKYPFINFSDRNLTFHFTSPSFSNIKGVEYQYKLDNNRWTNMLNPVLELNELRPGKYKLYVRAKHHETVWSNEFLYNFQVERPFYVSWWFYVLCFLTIVSWLGFAWRSKLRRIQQTQKVRLEYEQEINKLQLKALQAMMNPHFVFNSLSAIQQQINAGENQKANTYLTRFSKLLRKNLESINELYITIEEEISRLKLYLESEKMRLENYLDYTISCNSDIDTKSWLIPTMLLQPLVENAIWHGIMPSGKKGRIKIEFHKDENRLIIIIEDNGIGYHKSKLLNNKSTLKEQALGMKITSDRLKYLSQKLGSLIDLSIKDLSDHGGEGTQISIVMDIIEE